MKNKIVSREEWQAHRAALLEEEKAHTRDRERLATLRQELPWVRLDTNYSLLGEQGEIELTDLFEDCSQLMVYHLMFGADWDAPCIGCTQWADAFNGTTQYFKKADARLIAVSTAPIEKVLQEKENRGWSFSWLSSSSSHFNRDFHGADDEKIDSSRDIGTEMVHFDRGENHGVSVFYKDEDDQIYHTYSVYNRGIEPMNGAFGYYDILPKGRAW